MFTNWLEIDAMYTDYCDDCYEIGVEPKTKEEWYKWYKDIF
jgi:hypothetical protein